MSDWETVSILDIHVAMHYEWCMAIAQGPYYKALGANIREFRKKKPLTQAELAVALGLTRTSITNIEMGRQPVYVHVLAKLAEHLSTTVADLLPPAQRLDAALESHLSGLPADRKKWIASVISEERP